jgi:hypothetical protein
MSSLQSNVNFPVLLSEIWFKIIEICELDSLYSMYCVSKLFQQIIEITNLLLFWICLVDDPDMCEFRRKNRKSSTNNFLCHHKFLQRIKHYKLEFLTHEELLYLFDNPQLISMINMLEINTCIIGSRYDYQPILKKALQFSKITTLSLVNTIISRNFPEIFSKNHSLQKLNFRNGILPSSSMDFSTCSFVEFSLDNMDCKSGTSIKMPDCLKECDLSCYLIEIGLLPDSFIEFQMSHCKKLNTL